MKVSIKPCKVALSTGHLTTILNPPSSRFLPQLALAVHRRGLQCNATFPDFVPAEFACEIQEPAAVEMLQQMRRVELQVPGLGNVQTAYYSSTQPQCSSKDPPAPPKESQRPAFVLLHGFDSSNLEFRRFAPLLSQLGDVFAVDLAGWGFTDAGFGSNPNITLGPQQKRAHLRAFCEKLIGRPAVVIGASLGGTVALDFALEHPELVEKLVLVDAQGFIDGIGPLASMPRFLSVLGVQVLRSVALRQMANQMAYCDKGKYATDDAMRVGRLHTHLPGWVDANVAFMRSGGYAVSTRLSEVACPALICWGRQDEILSPDYAPKFIDALPSAKLVWIDQCGHVPALEQPQALLEAVSEFVGAHEQQENKYTGVAA